MRLVREDRSGLSSATYQITGTRVTPFTGSINAAVTLVERLLPEFDWIIGHTNDGIFANVGPGDMQFGATPPLAILYAMLTALLNDAPA